LFTVLTIARPVWLALQLRPFQGHVHSCFGRACNLINDAGQIITLTLPAIGNGPFFIVIDAPPDAFTHIQPHQPVTLDAAWLMLGAWRLSMATATLWEPSLPTSTLPFSLTPALATCLRPYTQWPRASAASPLAAHSAAQLAQGTHKLMTALTTGANPVPAVQQLAGLGNGLTPAGDDYLLGVTDGDGALHGIAAVIDKDLSSALLANRIGADVLLLCTGVEKVAIHYGKPNQVWLGEITLAQAKQYLAEGIHFAKGSMAPRWRRRSNIWSAAANG